MEAVIHVQNLTYCKVKIEGANMPPSMNIVDSIIIQDGIGIAAPTLTLYFTDGTGALQNEMNLVQGTKCTITLGKSGDGALIARDFSLWGLRRSVTSSGPIIQAVFTLDVPKWIAGVYCENFNATSSGAIGAMAGASGLQYDGPGSTNDKMNWLNINCTRSSFSEDVAMRGYAGASSCMARVLTMDKKLRYKDLFKQMRTGPQGTFCHSMEPTGTNPYIVQETQDSSYSGVMAHWFNFGQIQYEHSLNDSGQLKTDKIQAPVMGDSFPISDRIKGIISSSEGSRVTYTGFDTGTAPKDAPNLHEFYEKAFYQNLRGLGLFSERLRVLIPYQTSLHTLDSVDYKQNDPAGDSFAPSRALNGRYLIAGKTIVIKNGHNYSETFDLIRSYVANPGKSAMASSKAPNAKANAKDNLAEGRKTDISTSVPTTPKPISAAKDTKSLVEKSQALCDSLNKLNEVLPRLPDSVLEPPGSLSDSDALVIAQKALDEALQDIHSDSNPLSDIITESNAGFDPEKSFTVKRVSAAAIKTSANETIEEMQRHVDTKGPISDPANLSEDAKARTKIKLEKPVIDRFSGSADEIKGEVFESIVTRETSESIKVGADIGDILKGGVFAEDFSSKGRSVPDVFDKQIVSAAKQVSDKGTNFAFPASKFGIGENDALVKPAAVAEYLLELTESAKKPKTFLQERGVSEYEKTFGDILPTEAKTAIDKLKTSAEQVKSTWNKAETVVRKVETAVDNAESEVQSATTSTLKTGLDYLAQKVPGATIKPPIVKSGSTVDDARKTIDNITTSKKPVQKINKFVEEFDFQFGETGVAPLIEKVHEKIEDANAVIVQTEREMASWGKYARIGNNEALEAEIQLNWEFPSGIPFKEYKEGVGQMFYFSDTKE